MSVDEWLAETPEKIEAMAKAICGSRSCEGVHCCQWPANRGRINCHPYAYMDAAKDALAALRNVLMSDERTSDE